MDLKHEADFMQILCCLCRIYAKFMQFMPNLCSLYAQYAKNIMMLNLKLVLNMQNKNAQNAKKNTKKIEKNLQKIKTRYAKYAKHATNMQQICTICKKYVGSIFCIYMKICTGPCGTAALLMASETVSEPRQAQWIADVRLSGLNSVEPIN